MKYKVGDKVKVINNDENYYNIGDIVRIVKIDDSEVPYRCSRLIDGKEQWLKKEDFELVKYTWEDFLKAPTATKVTFESGELLIKNNETFNQFESKVYYRDYEDLEDFKDKCGDLGKIMKIEEPTYITVYESEEIKEMTIAELEKKLGYKIKIVKEK